MSTKPSLDVKDVMKNGKEDVELTDWELEVVTKVFRSFETGLREGTILPKVGNNMFVRRVGWWGFGFKSQNW